MMGAEYFVTTVSKKITGGLLTNEIRCQINKFKQDRRLSG